ncbi:DUF2264 domain-containing protein [Nibricoccus aquaticus]|nr:DUF2264 domain-containing protein [Nibricoccus aquaticus]
MRFVPENPDFRLSPFSGMAREHWVQAAVFLLEGVFAHLGNVREPLVFPRRSPEAYPRPGATWVSLRAQEMEGLARTFLIAAPLIEENPDLMVRGINVRDYYARQILQACDPSSPTFMGHAEDIARANGGQLAQQLVEVAALCIGLMSARTSVWSQYSEMERATIAACFHDHAHGKTHPHNWRFFNVLTGAFLEANEVAVDAVAMDGHLHALMAFYAGDGWYRDGLEFDYYSAWAFQFYGALWCDWTGYQRRPETARMIERRHGELMAVYPHFFGRNGESLLWGRSAIYRCAASSPLVAAFRLRETPIDPGWARRIASGNLLQFLGRDDLWMDEIPSLGFFGPCDPVLQSYSCAASPFWLAKIFQALSLPKDSPFWTAVENEGEWPRLGSGVQTVLLERPGLMATIHGSTGAAECRPGKLALAQSWYQRLAFNTAFPWEADDEAGATAMSYSLRRLGEDSSEAAGKWATPVAMRHGGFRDGVLYRQIIFRRNSPMPDVVIDLADIVIPGGVLRVDRVRADGECELRLGHFGLPHLHGMAPEIREWREDGAQFATAVCGERGLLLATYRGWSGVAAQVHTCKNVEAETSTVLYAVRSRGERMAEVSLLVTLMLHRTDGRHWTASETDLVREIVPATDCEAGVTVCFKDGEERTVDFSRIEGRLGG